jgi:hypothetical protein
MDRDRDHARGSKMGDAIRSFIATYDACDASDREIATRIRCRLLSELYRREREAYPEWIDLGGEA